ncbi:MAG TPA: hypothetical protein VD813_12075 [Pseudonocardia sp.]|nr:hypothetical protein [Pseudonocardia sp.]
MVTTASNPSTTLSTRLATPDGGRLLRLALRLDAGASGLLGVLAVVAAPALATLLGPPSAVLVGVGAFLVVFAAGLLVLAARAVMPPAAVRVVVVGNLAWSVASVVAVVAGWSVLTGLGVAVVLAQALAVTAFADLQWLGLRRTR